MVKDQQTGSSVFIAEVADGVAEKGTRNNTSVNVDTPLVAFWEHFHTCTLPIKCRSIRIFGGRAFR